MFASYLRWDDVVPSKRPPFDPEQAARVVHPLVVAGKGADRNGLEASIDRALLAEYGAWVAGWRWAAGDGGPINAWCCAPHSLYRDGDARERDSTDRVVAAMSEWSAFLTELESIFAELPDGTGKWLVHDVEVAAARLLPLVVERTRTEDAWYGTFAKVLTWYGESRGHEAEVIEEAIDEVISGHFKSWCEPSPEAVLAVTRELPTSLNAALDAMKPDATVEWWKTRPRAFANQLAERTRQRVRHDGHLQFINGPERRRDPERADAMAVGLDACRASALAGEPLSFDLLAQWQAIILGEPQRFRSTDAFAKGGRERYGATPKVERRFEACLQEANDPSTPVIVRAARVYLDVCFFHPFEDGNARAARLALDHVLSRAQLGVHAMEPLVLVARSAYDARGAWYFAHLLDYLAGLATEEA